MAKEGLIHSFPTILPRRRRVYHEGLCAEEIEELRVKGYDAVALVSLPRETADDSKSYLLATLQAMNDGLCERSDLRRKAVELELKAYSMLNGKDREEKGVRVPTSIAHELLDWAKSRQSNIGNSTVQSVVKLKTLKTKEIKET
jgi:hypothetical protein